MIRALLSIACHVYGAAAIVYLAYLVRQRPVLAWVGRTLIGAGMLVHAFGLGAELFDQGGAPLGLAQGFSTVALVLFALFFALDLRYRVPVLGAFLAPLALALLVPGVILGGAGGVLPGELRAPLLPLHITVALLGFSAFAFAAGVGAVYLLMERQVKGKKFGLWFSRLPPLETLDALNRWLVIWGFLALSFTFVTGAFFASASPGLYWAWQAKEVGTAGAWLVFASLLGARLFAGWRGRRVAVLTMAGFALVLVSFLGSYDLVDPGRPVMDFLCVGLSHKTAPVSVREQLAIAPDRQHVLLQTLVEHLAGEAMLVSTCNRVEFYLAAPSAERALEVMRMQLSALGGPEALDHLYTHHGEHALQHLFRVSASLDSMVLGEPQILGQVKDAFELGQKAGTIKGELSRACAAAFGSAKRVRTETEIGKAASSMASAAVDLAKKIFGGLAGRPALVVGAGEMGEIAARAPRRLGSGADHDLQPDLRPRRGARGRARRAGAAVRRAAGAAPDGGPGGLLDRVDDADLHPGERGAGDQGAPPPAAVHGRPRGAAGHRPRGERPRGRLRVRRRRPAEGARGERRGPERGGDPGGGDHRPGARPLPPGPRGARRGPRCSRSCARAPSRSPGRRSRRRSRPSASSHRSSARASRRWGWQS